MNQIMKEIPESERPYEKCIRDGEAVLSDSELLAVILRCGTRGMNSLGLGKRNPESYGAFFLPGTAWTSSQFTGRSEEDSWDRYREGSTA